jgi:glutathione synthase/RimK-type ligase-like ATP-grasp enzyme
MNHAQVTISHHSNPLSSLPVVSLSSCVLKKLEVPTDLPLRLSFSNHHSQVVCKENNAKTNMMQIDERIAKQIGIPEQCALHLSYNPHTQDLMLGPVFAVLVSGLSKANPPFSVFNTFCEEVLRFARHRHVFAYITTLKELFKAEGTVKGWTYTQNRWEKVECPYPQVVYNRISSRKIENTSTYTEIKKRMSEKKIHLFNQTFLNKWEVYERLKEDKELLSHLPRTHMFGPLTLKTMIEQCPVVFIKPIHGSLGRGIYRVSRKINGFESQYTTPNGQIQKHFNRLSQLYSYLGKRVRAKNYIIQQGIPILHKNGRAIDFRALMQKNSTGEWGVTSMVARIGPENRFVSNIAGGGELNKVLPTLNRCNIADPKKVRLQLLRVAKKSCDIIEESYKNKFGELGVDLAITRSGKVYILEINSKPSKTEDSVSVQITQSKGRPSVHRLLDYTLFLMNNPKK